jgi:hypothetical protein
MNSRFDLTGAERARRRGAGVVFFRPPAESRVPSWHIVQTHLGERRLQWRPGIDVWYGDDKRRWTAEFAGEAKWRYVRPDPGK